MTKSEAELQGQMSLMEHLSELRTRIVRSAIALALGAIVAYIFHDFVMDILLDPYCSSVRATETNDECRLLVLGPLEAFSVRLTVSGYIGLGLAMPVILWQVWQFIAPGLYPQEKRYGLAFVIASFLLFVLGAALAYWTLPRALAFLQQVGYDEFQSTYRPKEYIGFIVKMMIGFGIGFEFPILLIFLQIMGLIDNATLRAGRRYALVGIVALVAVLTPSGDPLSLMALSVPMYLFYEVAIGFGRWRARRSSK